MAWSGGCCLLAILLAWPAVALAQSASGFDAAGITTIRIGARPVDDVSGAVRLASGHVLLAGTFSTGSSQAFLARLSPDGTPDPGFGTGGVATLPAPSFGFGVAAHPAGGAVLLATTELSSAQQVAVAHFTETGTLDPGYGAGGVGTAAIPDLLGVSGVAVSGTGRAFVAGTAGDPARAVVLRFDAAGNLDPTYGAAGVAMGGPDTGTTGLVVTAAGVAFGAGIDGVYAPSRSLAVFCFDAAGNPCAGFGGGTGMATSTLGAASSIGRAVGVDGTGRVVVAGVTESPGFQAAVARFTSTGAADATFNGGLGYRLLGLPGQSIAHSLVIDAGNRIVVGGYQAADLMFGTPRQAMATRVTAAGALDATFGVGGHFTKNIGGADNMVSLALDPGTGGLLLAGSTGPPEGGSRSAVTLALTSGGAPDPAHGSGGAVIAALSSAASCPASDVALQPDGRMLVTGEATFPDGQRPYVGRLNLDGTLDASFGSAGVTILPSAVARNASEIAVAADGSSMAVLSLPQSLVSQVVLHLRADGALDTEFGSAGVASIPSIPNAIYLGLLPLAGGGVLASGRENDVPGGIVVAKFTAQGAVDPAFGAGGATQISGGNSDFGQDMRVLADGRILVAASVGGSPGLVRLMPTGEPDPTFGTDGVVSLPLMGGGTTLLSAGDDGVLLGGFLPNPPSGLLLARFDRDGVPDLAFGMGGVVTDSSVAPTDGLAGMVVDPAGCIIVGGIEGDTDETRATVLARFLPDGSPDPTFGTGGRMTANVGLSPSASGFALDASGNALVVGSISVGLDRVGMIARLPAACSDGNACTVDQCLAGVGCTHTQLLGIPGARCLCGVLPRACDGQSPPASVGKKSDKACSALEAAESAAGKKRKKGLVKARRLLKEATRKAARAGRGKKPKLGKECATALGANFTEQRVRALEALKGS